MASCIALIVHLNGQLFGRPDAGVDMTFNFTADRPRCQDAGTGGQLHRRLGNRLQPAGQPARLLRRQRRSRLLLPGQVRMYETIETGKPQTPFLKFGDTVRIEMFDDAGASLFGAIEQRVEKY